MVVVCIGWGRILRRALKARLSFIVVPFATSPNRHHSAPSTKSSPQPQPNPNPTPTPPQPQPQPQLDKVSFTYPGAPTPTLSGVHVMCRLSSRVAVIGANGAGKSTLIKVGL